MQLLRHQLREYFPAALEACDGLDAPDTLELLDKPRIRAARRCGRNPNAALSPLLAVTNVPVIPARLIARSVEAFGGSFAVSRRGTSVGICAPASACPLEIVIDCSPRALAALAPAR